MSNVPYTSFSDLQKAIRDDQKWADDYIQVLADFMGDSETIKAAMGPNVAVVTGRLMSPVNTPTISYSAGHWYARLPGDTKAFNPYDEYQIPRSRQFCQTYCLMYLTGKLPAPNPKNPWVKYYMYTFEALTFMRMLVDTLPSSSPAFKGDTTRGPRKPKKHIIKCINECLRRPYMCVNLTA